MVVLIDAMRPKGFPGLVKNLLASAGGTRKMCSLPGWGRVSGGGQGNPLQDRGAWWATPRGVAKSWTRLKQLSTLTHIGPKGSTKYVTCKTFQDPSN